MNMENNTKFTYTYSSKEQEEIRNIRKKYMPPEENKMEQLRRLDRQAVKKGTVAAVVVACISMFLLGIGMCCSMVWAGSLFYPGIIIGVAGILGIVLDYPVYAHITKKERKKLAPQIMKLTEELMQ